MNPYPILYIEYGVAYIPMWQWDSGREDIFGYPVATAVTDERPVPNNGHARRQEGESEGRAPDLLPQLPQWLDGSGDLQHRPPVVQRAGARCVHDTLRDRHDLPTACYRYQA